MNNIVHWLYKISIYVTAFQCYYYKDIYPKYAEQLEQRLFFIAKQHNIPIGKKNIAQNIPRQV